MIVNKTLKFIVPLLNIEKSKIITKDFKGAYNCFKVNEDPYQVYLHYNCQNNNLTTNYFNHEGTVYKLDSKNLSKEIKQLSLREILFKYVKYIPLYLIFIFLGLLCSWLYLNYYFF